MGKIKILPEDLINKIAAGEVVERPASVVKELLDNAYDANATNITIEIEDGGMKKIQVTDNGSGIDKDDIKLTFKSHATSKLTSESDLLNIKQYGFRGEALASIASVSKVTLKSRTNADDLGSEIKVEGNNIGEITEIGTPMGTTVIVEDLFYNVPARKEFVKSAQSEYRAILEIVDAYAMAKPDVGLSLINNGKAIYSFPKNHQLEDRIREIMGNDFYEKLIPVFYEHPHIEIYGFVSKPELASEKKKQQYIFVNKRAINNKSISFAVKNAYESLIPKNTYPAYIIFIDVPSNIVDVNVHPRKEEVKFSNDGLIFDSVKSAVKKALDRTNLTPGNLNTKGLARDPFSPFGNNDPFAMPKKDFSLPPFQSPRPFTAPAGKMPVKPSPLPGFDKIPQQKFGAQSKPPYDPSFDPFKSDWDDEFNELDSDFGEKPETPNPMAGKILQIHNLYLVTESEEGVIIYDQHAVHERVIYEKLLSNFKDKKEAKNIQPLAIPAIVSLSTQETQIIEEYISQIEDAGFKLENFGPNTYKITEIPAIASDLDIKSLLHELIEDLENDEKSKEVDNVSHKVLTYLSCRMAYKAGDALDIKEAAALISKLDETEIKYTCPHGRPVKVEITLKELSKMFKRT